MSLGCVPTLSLGATSPCPHIMSPRRPSQPHDVFLGRVLTLSLGATSLRPHVVSHPRRVPMPLLHVVPLCHVPEPSPCHRSKCPSCHIPTPCPSCHLSVSPFSTMPHPGATSVSLCRSLVPPLCHPSTSLVHCVPTPALHVVPCPPSPCHVPASRAVSLRHCHASTPQPQATSLARGAVAPCHLPHVPTHHPLLTASTCHIPTSHPRVISLCHVPEPCPRVTSHARATSAHHVPLHCLRVTSPCVTSLCATSWCVTSQHVTLVPRVSSPTESCPHSWFRDSSGHAEIEAQATVGTRASPPQHCEGDGDMRRGHTSMC